MENESYRIKKIGAIMRFQKKTMEDIGHSAWAFGWFAVVGSLIVQEWYYGIPSLMVGCFIIWMSVRPPYMEI